MRIAIITPGFQKWPVSAWGACELVCEGLGEALKELGHTVDYVNDETCQGRVDINRLITGGYDWIHSGYDDHAGILNRYLPKNQWWGQTCHYGYLNQPELWQPGYQQIFDEICKAPCILPLSIRAKAQFVRKVNSTVPMPILPNGVNTQKFKIYPKGNGRLIFVGKLDGRKGEDLLQGLQIPVDFVGPKTYDFIPNAPHKYLGEWTREQLYENLGAYSGLVLLSKGENHCLVGLEAMAAGIPMILSEEASENFKDVAFVIPSVREQPHLHDSISAICSLWQSKSMESYREYVREQAEANWDWSIIAANYAAVIKETLKWPHGIRTLHE